MLTHKECQFYLYLPIAAFFLAAAEGHAQGPLTLNPAALPGTPHVDPSAVGHGDSYRYGPLGVLNRRSIYGHYWFPEPLRADEADVDDEVRLDYFHAENHDRQFDSGRLELEKSFGLLTLEVAGRYQSDRMSMLDPQTGAIARDTQEGIGNLELGVRAPIYQYVSPREFFDTTFVLGLEISPPVHTNISKDIEFVPKLFNLTRLGKHLSVQTGVGISILAGPQGHGLSTLEYDGVLGYELTRRDLPLPLTLSTTPILELDGEYTLNQEEAGHNELFATAGFRFNFESLSFLPAQPRLGLGYTFPIDGGARKAFDWGVVTSMVFEY